MILGVESVTRFSEDASKLADFYKKNLGMSVVLEAQLAEDKSNIFGLEFEDGSGFFIVDHSKIKGRNKEPERTILNFQVDDIRSETNRLEQLGIKKIQDVYLVENYGLISTFEDIDGNFFQLVQLSDFDV